MRWWQPLWIDPVSVDYSQCGKKLGQTGSPNASDSVVAVPPSGSIGESGNVGVVTQIAAVPGSIGYAEAANSLSKRVPSSGINFAKVNGKNPIKNLPSPWRSSMV
jgi:hypothetical protein